MHQDLLCQLSATFAVALRQIDRNAKGVVCVVDDAEAVVGILTDGDIRLLEEAIKISSYVRQLHVHDE